MLQHHMRTTVHPILYGSREADSQKFTETVYKKLDEKLESGVIPRSQEAAFREAVEEELRVFRNGQIYEHAKR